MECSCNAGFCGDNDDLIGYAERKLKAAKKHICPECKKIINKGEYFMFHSIMMIDDISNHKMCLVCHEISEVFFKDGFIFEQLLEDLYLYFDASWLNDLPSNCISKLSPPARDVVCDILQKFQQ